MTKRVLVALAMLCVGLASAGWQSIAGGTGGADISIVEQGRLRTVVDVTLPGIETTPIAVDGREFVQLGIPGDVMATIEIGRPRVPKVSLLLARPNGARVSVRATVLETVTLAVGNVYPLQEPLLDGEPEPPFTINEDAYHEDAAFPGRAVSLIETGTWRDLDVANIQVYPVQVNPARGEITVAKKVRVEVSYTGGSYPVSVPDWMSPTYGAFIDNYSSLRLEPRVDYDEGTRYLVFCHDAWSSNSMLNDSLLGWVQKRGYDIRVVVKTSFTAAEIKDSIRNEYNRHSPAVLQHVLFVGESNQVPTGSYSGVGVSDFYYTDLLPSPTGDNYPEVSLARLSPVSGTDLDNQIRKILKYQKDPAAGGWLDKMSFVAHREQYPGKYSACVRGCYNMPKPYWQPVLDTIMGQFTGNAAVTSAVNAGVGILAYRGHGDATEWWSWCADGSWYNSHVAALANGDYTPVTQHWACICGNITVAECHAEAWMRKYPGGAVSALGATQASYTYPNHGQCSTIVRAMTDTWNITVPGVRDYSGPVFSIGEQMGYMDAYLAKYWPGSPYYYNIWMYLNLGEPSMPVWAGTPATPVVDFPDSIPTGPYTLNVGVTVGGRPVENALVCAWKDGDFYVVERTDGTGNASLDVSATTGGEVLITVSEGHAEHSTPGVVHTSILPFEGSTMAGGGGAPQPNVRYVSNLVDDAGGNNNGRFDPGETADIIVTVRNAGNGPATNLTGKLRAYHAQFSVTDSTSAFGTVAPGVTVDNDADRFTAMADNGIPGGTAVRCTLLLHSDAFGDWAYGFQLQVGDPPIPAQYMITLDTGAVRLSVCGIGSIGYDEPPADAGSGFQVPKSAASALFFGGLMAGNDPAWLVDHHFGVPASATNHDWTMTDSFRYQVPAAPADVHWRGAMSDAGHPSSKGLDLTWDWHMTAQGGYDDWAIVELQYTNNGSADINGFYTGMIGDFDIGSSSTTNTAASDTTVRAIWMRQASSANPCAGFVVLNPMAFANLSAIDHAIYVYPTDSCMNDGQKWRFLNGTIVLRQSNRSYDWSIMASAGPFDIPVGGICRAAFAVVGGLDESGFIANAESAQSWYNGNLLGIQEPPTRVATERRPLFLSPNPFSRGTFVHYYAPLAGPVTLSAFDPAGREVERVEFTAAVGAGRYFWQPKTLARGIYFLKVRSEGAEAVAKVLLLD